MRSCPPSSPPPPPPSLPFPSSSSSSSLQWEEQHQGISCEEFAQWMADNDPEVQEQGLAAHLKSNGIGERVTAAFTA